MHPLAEAVALLAAVIHVWFFLMESVWFMRPSVWRRFGISSSEEASTVRSFAYNQGFYNLFLALGVGIGVALVATGAPAAGRAIVLFACGSMAAAGVILYLYNRSFFRAAAIQALPPLVAIAAAVLLP
jgi:putative membrane protein